MVTSEDLGRRLRVSVVATNADGTASAASGPTAPIGATGVNRAASQSHKKRGKNSVKAKTSKKGKKSSKKGSTKKSKKAKKKKAARKNAKR